MNDDNGRSMRWAYVATSKVGLTLKTIQRLHPYRGLQAERQVRKADSAADGLYAGAHATKAIPDCALCRA